MILADSFIAFCTLILAVLFYLDIAKIEHIYILLAFTFGRFGFSYAGHAGVGPFAGSEVGTGFVLPASTRLSSLPVILPGRPWLRFSSLLWR